MTLPTDPRDSQAHIPQQSSSATPTEPTAAAPQPVRQAKRWPWIAVAVVVAVLAVAGGLTYALMPSDDDTAVDRCQTAITDKLKSPSTAEYGDKVTVTSETGNFGTYYEVSGQVDAQNGFGAMVRIDYRCKVTRENDGRWLEPESTLTQG